MPCANRNWTAPSRRLKKRSHSRGESFRKMADDTKLPERVRRAALARTARPSEYLKACRSTSTHNFELVLGTDGRRRRLQRCLGWMAVGFQLLRKTGGFVGPVAIERVRHQLAHDVRFSPDDAVSVQFLFVLEVIFFAQLATEHLLVPLDLLRDVQEKLVRLRGFVLVGEHDGVRSEEHTSE